MPSQHQEASGDQLLASPPYTGEPPAGDNPGALYADVVAAQGHLAEVINQRLQFGPPGGEEGFAVEFGGQRFVFG
jgi:hypothetical protein